jgi:GNAT superfamily N-acetyltransferase
MHSANVFNHQLAAYLRHVGPAGVFSRYVIGKKAGAASIAAIHEEGIVGTAVSGRTLGLFEAYSHWIFADTYAAAAVLADALSHDDEIAINFPLIYFDLFQSICAARTLSLDCVYLLPASRFRPLSGQYDVQKLNSAELKQLVIGEELRPLLGALDDWQGGMHLYGIVQANQLVCVGEATVQDRELAVIQQLYTVQAYRGQNMARTLVSHVVERLIAEQKVPMYVVSEDNVASRRIAEKLGFILDSQWGFIA